MPLFYESFRGFSLGTQHECAKRSVEENRFIHKIALGGAAADQDNFFADLYW